MKLAKNKGKLTEKRIEKNFNENIPDAGYIFYSRAVACMCYYGSNIICLNAALDQQRKMENHCSIA